MPVHVRDLCSLSSTHPDVAREFRSDKFVIAKSQRIFPPIAIDHAHEQNNGKMKQEGGIVGLTQDDDALLKWSVPDPELVRVISEFESTIIGTTEDSVHTSHHEQTNASYSVYIRNIFISCQINGQSIEIS